VQRTKLIAETGNATEFFYRAWQYESAGDLKQSFVERLRQFPRQPDLLVYGLRTLVALAIRAWLRLYHRLDIQGREHLPRDRSFIMVANHASHLDVLCLLAALPLLKLHKAFPAAALDYFFVNLPRTAIAAIAINALPFGRQSCVRQSLERCRELLAAPGNILIVFPEGTRTVSGRIGAFKPGIAWLVAGTNIPVLPCHLDGAFDAWPKGQSLPRPKTVRLRIGAPRVYASYGNGREPLQQITSDLQRAVVQLAAKPQSL